MSDSDDDGSKWGKVKKVVTPSKYTFAKLSYCFLLAVGFLLAILLRDNFFGIVYKIPIYYCPPDISFWFFTLNNTCVKVHPYQDFIEPWFNTFGVKLTGFFSVHRITFAMGCYFFIHFFLSLVGCLPSRRVKFWAFSYFLNINPCVHAVKYMIFVVFTGLMFFIHDDFFMVIAWFSIFIAAFFLLIQVVLLIEMSWGWQDTFNDMHEKEDDSGSFGDDEKFSCTKGNCLYISSAAGVYIVMGFFLLFMFIIFSWGGCWYMIVTMIISTILCIILVVLSCIPALGSGILPPAIIALYGSCMCWSALLSYPSSKCNIFSVITDNVVGNSTTSVGGVSLNNFGQIFSIIYTAFFAIVTTVYSAISAGKKGSIRKAVCVDCNNCKEDDGLGLDDDDDEEKDGNREEAISMVEFHFVMVLVSFFFGTILTNWVVQDPHYDLKKEKYNINVSYVAFAIKLFMEFLALILTLWIMIKKKLEDRGDDDGF